MGKKRFYVNKWIVLSACIFVQFTSGLAYCFSLFSDALKIKFNLTQTQIETIGSMINCGGYSTVIAGLFYDAVGRLSANRWAPR